VSEAPWPNLVVVGAMRCGTTSLHAVLGRHPEVFASPIKGPGLFLDPRRPVGYPSKYHSHAEKRGFRSDAELRSAMARGLRGERWLAESTDVYARYPLVGPGVPERMLRARPEMRLVYLLRDPVERILSQHRFERAKPHRPARADLAAYLRSGADPIGASRYYTQLRRFLDAGFAREQVHVLTLEDLRRAPGAELERLARFLGVAGWPARAVTPLPHRNATANAPGPTPPRDCIDYLEEILTPEVQALEDWLGRRLPFGSAQARRSRGSPRAQRTDAYTASVRAASRSQP